MRLVWRSIELEGDDVFTDPAVGESSNRCLWHGDLAICKRDRWMTTP
jgi:hypothetical protein